MKAVVMHGGGPTAVLNANLAGVMEACHDAGWQLLGARFGRLSEGLIDLTGFTEDRIRAVAQAPGSAIGSSRRAIEDVGAAIESLRRQDVRALFYAGGNGSMAAALKLSQAAWDVGYELLVIGIPKTIDNDLMVTHHTPGYASRAYFSRVRRVRWMRIIVRCLRWFVCWRRWGGMWGGLPRLRALRIRI